MDVKLTPELAVQLEADGYRSLKEIPGKGICGLQAFVYTIGLMTGLDETGYYERFCYPHVHGVKALMALIEWDVNTPESEDMPDDKYWVKRKGQRGECGNPNT